MAIDRKYVCFVTFTSVFDVSLKWCQHVCLFIQITPNRKQTDIK